MCDALPGATVPTVDVQARFQAVATAVRSAKDVHVAACAYCVRADAAYRDSGAVVLATRNTRDFRKGALLSLGIALQKADDFLRRCSTPNRTLSRGPFIGSVWIWGPSLPPKI